MSLVHDALEKAKREAAAKSAKDLGLSESRIGAGQPFRARRRIHPALSAAGAAAVTLAAVGAIYLVSGSRTERATPPAPRAAPNGAPTQSAAPANGSIGTDPDSRLAVAAPPVQSAAPSGAATAPQPTSIATTAPTLQSAATSSPAPLPPARPAATADAARATTHVRQITLADGTVVRLGGIAWSQEAPLAYLNGKLYAKGESVAGLRIERIEKERIEFSGAGGRFILTLR